MNPAINTRGLSWSQLNNAMVNARRRVRERERREVPSDSPAVLDEYRRIVEEMRKAVTP